MKERPSQGKLARGRAILNLDGIVESF